jgi:hypothetical protein
MELFYRRYASRIQNTFSYRSLDKWYELYLEKGEDVFLDELEDEENFMIFCRRFYDILREEYNICSAGMRDSYEQCKVKFAGDDESYMRELMLAIDSRRRQK